VQGMLYATNDMQPTQANVASLIQQLHDQSIASYVLTARGPDYLNSTLRELNQRAKIEFKLAPECAGFLCDKRGVIPGAHVKASIDQLLPNVDSTKFGRNVNVEHGVMMVSGLNKGVMLRLLLENLPNDEYATVVFLDDSLKNVVDVTKHGKYISNNTLVYHYTKLEDNLLDFFKGKKGAIVNDRQNATNQAWTDIRQAVCQHNAMSWCHNTKK